MSLDLPDHLTGWVLDVAALVSAVDRTVYASTFLAIARREATTLLIPAGVLTATLALRPNRGPLLAKLLGHSNVRLVDPDDPPADLGKFAELLSGDLTAAHVVWLGVARDWPVLTDRGDYLRRAAPELMVIPA